AALGGGVEIALHCSARTISSAVRHFGLPEVFLGLFPAWGGTQLVPRLVGPEAAVKAIVSNPLRQNKLLSGAEAFQLGLADRLLGPGLALRVRPRRAPCEAGRRRAEGRAAPDPQGRDRRRGPDGDADRVALPAPARGADRAPRPRAEPRRRGARDDPRLAARAV